MGAPINLIIRKKREKMNPLIKEIGPSSSMTDAQLATFAGVPLAVITAFRSGVPYWMLETNAQAVANAIGVDVSVLRAAIAKAKKKIWGRGANLFPSSPISNMGDIRL